MGNIFASVATQIHERHSLPAVVQCAICARFGAIAASKSGPRSALKLEGLLSLCATSTPPEY
jgi:hypothetical protein